MTSRAPRAAWRRSSGCPQAGARCSRASTSWPPRSTADSTPRGSRPGSTPTRRAAPPPAAGWASSPSCASGSPVQGKLHALVEATAPDERDPGAARYRAFLLHRFRTAGAGLAEPDRVRVAELTAEIASLEQAFVANIEADRSGIAIAEADVDGLPLDLVARLARTADGRLRVGTAPAERVPFMAYARSDTLRRQLLEAFGNVANPANAPVLPQLLRARHELARTLGHGCWANLALARSMAGSVDRVRKPPRSLDRERAARARAQPHPAARLAPPRLAGRRSARGLAVDPHAGAGEAA